MSYCWKIKFSKTTWDGTSKPPKKPWKSSTQLYLWNSHLLSIYHYLHNWQILIHDATLRTYFGYGPFPVTVTTRIIPFLVGNPYEPLFATVTGKGPHPRHTFIDIKTPSWWRNLQSWGSHRIFRKCHHQPQEMRPYSFGWGWHSGGTLWFPWHHVISWCASNGKWKLVLRSIVPSWSLGCPRKLGNG